MLVGTVGVAPAEARPEDLMQAAAGLTRQVLSERWVRTQAAERADKARRVYYLSMEFLIGRTLANALSALNLRDDAVAALQGRALQLEEVAEEEADAALGNGGLGRLAACFLDSMATLGLQGRHHRVGDADAASADDRLHRGCRAGRYVGDGGCRTIHVPDDPAALAEGSERRLCEMEAGQDVRLVGHG